jgi:hypothetical protein
MLIALLIVAGWAPRASSGAIIALNPEDPNSLYLSGLVTLDAGTGSVQVNSSSSSAAVFQGKFVSLIAGEVNVVGGVRVLGTPALSAEINLNQPWVPDPLAGLPAPAVGSPVGPPRISGSGTFQPGYYPQGLGLFLDNNVTLMPGVYILDNGFDISGSVTLHGEGVMFYIRSGAVQYNGTGSMFLAPPTEGVYQGITFFQARDNTNGSVFNGTAPITGFGDAAGIGTLYFPAARVNLSGTADIYINGIVADKIEASGNGVRKVIVPEPSGVILLVLAGAGLMRRMRGCTA